MLPLTRLLKKKNFIQGEEAMTIFAALKESVLELPLLGEYGAL
jgi:hypothetical protein